LYIHFISPNIGSNNTQNIHKRTHTPTHTRIHRNNIYTHTINYIRGGADSFNHSTTPCVLDQIMRSLKCSNKVLWTLLTACFI